MTQTQTWLREGEPFKSQQKDQFNDVEMARDVRYHTLFLKVTNDGALLDEAGYILHVPELLVEINQNDIIRLKTSEYIRIEKAINKDFAIVNGLLPINFTDKTKTLKTMQDVTAIGTLGVANFTLSVKLGNDAGLVNPKIEYHAEVDAVQEAPGIVRHLQRDDWAVTDTSNLRKKIEGRQGTARAHHFLMQTATDIETLELTVDDKRKLNHAPDIIRAWNIFNQYTPDDKHVIINFEKRIFSDAQPMEKKISETRTDDVSMQYLLKMAQANSLVFIEDVNKVVSI